MIISIVVVLPVTHIITFTLIEDTVFQGSGEGRPPWFDRSSGPPNTIAFRIVQAVVTGTILFWLGIGIRQWFVFKMDKKYKQYKDLQKKIDEKLDFDSDRDDEKNNDQLH
ncbi:MAG: hypothetical protein ACJ719_15075 [Nitrososphaeraceae archaeon]